MHYIAVINMQDSSRVLTPALESVIGSKIALTEDRINRIVFKLCNPTGRAAFSLIFRIPGASWRQYEDFVSVIAENI